MSCQNAPYDKLEFWLYESSVHWIFEKLENRLRDQNCLKARHFFYNFSIKAVEIKLTIKTKTIKVNSARQFKTKLILRSMVSTKTKLFSKTKWLFMINLSIIVGFRGRKMDSWRRKKYFWACDSSDWCSRCGSAVVVGSSTVPYQTVPYRTGPLYTRLRSIRGKWDHPFPGDTTSPFHLTHNTRLKLSATY